jgi:hypothetical protein
MVGVFRFEMFGVGDHRRDGILAKGGNRLLDLIVMAWMLFVQVRDTFKMMLFISLQD